MSSAAVTPTPSSSISVAAISSSHSTSITFCVVRPQFFSSAPLRRRPLSLSPISHPSPLHPSPPLSLSPYPSPHFPSSPSPPPLRSTSSNLNSAVSPSPSPPGEQEEEEYEELDCGGHEDEDEGASPWEGAVVYRRDPVALHAEYCTTLERLGLGKVSSKLTVSRASLMGLRLTPRAARECGGEGVVATPVLVSLDVTPRSRRKRSVLRLDGIIRTVIALDCNRCGQPAAENIFSNFSLLLTDTPIEEQDPPDMGVIYGDDKPDASAGKEPRPEDDDIELDDRLYFPAGEKEIDISKHIRDLVHVEITIDAICDLNCKGICLECGVNLNAKSCKCSKDGRRKDAGLGPLGDLRNQMRQKKG